MRLAHQGAEGVGAAQTAHAGYGEIHLSSLAGALSG